MSQWDDRFLNHPALESLRELQQVLDQVTPRDAEDAEDIARLRSITAFALSVADQVDPEFVTPGMLDPVQRVAQTILIEVRAYQGSPDTLRLTDGNTEADELLDAVSRWPRPISASDLEGLRERASSFRASVGQFMRRLEDEVQQLEQRAQELQAGQESLREQLSTEVGTFREAADANVADLTATVDLQKGRLDQAISEFQQQFSTAESQRSQRFEANAGEQQARVTELTRDLQERGEAGLQGFLGRGEETLSELRAKAGEARRLAVSLGAIGVSGGHGQYAREQQKSADFWRGVSVASLLVVAVIAVTILLTLPAGGVDWERYVGRVLITAPFIGIAGYAATQSAKHRRAEREARKVDLDLAALELYLELFPDDRKNEIKEKIGLQVFGQPLAADGKDYEGIGASQLWDFFTKTFGK
jgi:hypothetical protein